jgi:hypothetical protein
MSDNLTDTNQHEDGCVEPPSSVYVYADSEGNALVSPFSLEENDKDLLAKQLDWLTHLPRRNFLQSAWANSGKRGINPNFFLLEMEYRWRVELENMVTPKLRELWLAMAEAFNRLIEAKPGDPWLILSPETGTGKTQGSCLYAALLGLYTTGGVLFTTRLTSQCDEAVATVNDAMRRHCRRYGLQEKRIAVAYHSNQTAAERPSYGAMAETPCLVITHSLMTKLYDEALEVDGGWNSRIQERFDALTQWNGGVRIRITDETPAGMVKDFNLVGHNMKKHLAPFMSSKLDPEETKAIMAVQAAWDSYEEESAANNLDGKMFVLSDHLGEVPTTFALSDHFAYIRSVEKPPRGLSKANFEKDREAALSTLQGVQHILHSWSVFLKDWNGCFITTAKLITPPDDMPMAVLDATAATSPYWKVFNKPKEVVKVPPSIRDYRNVTLHTCFQSGWTGKGGSEKGARKRIEEIFSYFEEEHQATSRKRKVLFVLHKDAEKHIPHEVIGTLPNGEPERAFHAPPFTDSLQVAHWKAIDGRNDFKDCDTVVIISLPYPPDHFGINLLFSNTDPDNRTDGLLEASKETRKDLMFGETMVNIIQAINRVRCRRVTTKDGGCEETDVFIVLPRANEDFTQDLLATLNNEMKGLNTKRWNILVDGKEKTGVRKGSSGDRLVRLLMEKPVGEYLFSELMAELEASQSGQKELRRSLGQDTSSLSQAMASAGWRYEVRRVGQRDRAVVVPK